MAGVDKMNQFNNHRIYKCFQSVCRLFIRCVTRTLLLWLVMCGPGYGEKEMFTRKSIGGESFMARGLEVLTLSQTKEGIQFNVCGPYSRWLSLLAAHAARGEHFCVSSIEVTVGDQLDGVCVKALGQWMVHKKC